MWTILKKCVNMLHNINDAALGCPLKVDKELSSNPFVDWKIVSEILKKKDLYETV